MAAGSAIPESCESSHSGVSVMGLAKRSWELANYRVYFGLLGGYLAECGSRENGLGFRVDLVGATRNIIESNISRGVQYSLL
jgi:hypothetical protein